MIAHTVPSRAAVAFGSCVSAVTPSTPTPSADRWEGASSPSRCASPGGETDARLAPQEIDSAWEVWGVVPLSLTGGAFTKRDRIPLAHQDWLAAVCHCWGMGVVADGLFPRLFPAARRAALRALLAVEANGDVYLVGRDPHTGALQTVPAPSASFVLEPQRFRLYIFASEDPTRLVGAWRSLKVWSLRWQADPFPLGATPWRAASWPAAQATAHVALHAPGGCVQSFYSVGGRS